MSIHKKLARKPNLYITRAVKRSVKSMKWLRKPGIRTYRARQACIEGCGQMVLIGTGKLQCRTCRREKSHKARKLDWKNKKASKPKRIPRHQRRLAKGLPIKVGPIEDARTWS